MDRSEVGMDRSLEICESERYMINNVYNKVYKAFSQPLLNIHYLAPKMCDQCLS